MLEEQSNGIIGHATYRHKYEIHQVQTLYCAQMEKKQHQISNITLIDSRSATIGSTYTVSLAMIGRFPSLSFSKYNPLYLAN